MVMLAMYHSANNLAICKHINQYLHLQSPWCYFQLRHNKYGKKNKQIYISGVVMATSVSLTVWFICIFVPLINGKIMKVLGKIPGITRNSG